MYLMKRQPFMLLVGALFAVTMIAPTYASDSSIAKSATADIDLHELRPGVWMHTSYYTYPDGTRYPSNGLIVREKDHLLLVDTAWGELRTVDLLDRIKAKIGLPVHRAIVTHAHGARLAGVDVLEARGIKVYALPLTQSQATGEGLPVPDSRLEGLNMPGNAIQFGNVEIFYPGRGHAPDNIMVWVPSQRVLFGGCAARADDSHTLGGVADANMVAWLKAIQRARTHYALAELVVPGHGKPGGLELLDHTMVLLKKQTVRDE